MRNMKRQLGSRRAEKLTESSELGADGIPAAIQALHLVARGFGLNVDPLRLIRDNQISDIVVSSVDLMRCAASAGLRATGLRPGWQGLRGLSNALPAIVTLRDGHAMVLLRVDKSLAGQIVVVQDPRSDEQTLLSLNHRQFASMWSGEVVLLQRAQSKAETNQPFGFGQIAALIFRDRAAVRDVVISALMLSLLALAPIMFWRLMTERALQYHAMSTFIVISAIMATLIGFETVFSILRRLMLLRITTRVDVKLTTDMFARVLMLPVEYFERTPAGMTTYKMAQIGRIRAFLVGQLFGTVLDSGILLFFVPVMFFFSPVLTAVVLAIATLICLIIILMLPQYRRYTGAVEAIESERGAFLGQTIHGIRTVKSLSLESRQTREWDSLTARVARAKFAEGNYAALLQALVMPLERLMISGSFALGVYLALTTADPTVTSSLFVFLLLSQRLAAPLIQASQLVQQFDEARAAVGIVGSLVNQPLEEGRSGDGVRNPIRGHVEFSKVLFTYKGALKPALKEVSFEIPQGTTLGVMGRSGSGKTTITRLVQRLNTDYSGLLKIDGVDVRQYDLTHLRSSLGVVLQENFLFSGTIRSNITIAKPDATFDEMVHAARLAGAEEFIEKLPGGYETQIYEGSPNLSGGQRQRLAIARALITDPKILILDEATSALDAESEAIVNANIDRIAQGRTIITISHRLASLVKADAILVMEQGEVNDIGKHHELLERNEIYAHLWYTQNPHTAAPAAGPRPQLTYRGPRDAA